MNDVMKLGNVDFAGRLRQVRNELRNASDCDAPFPRDRALGKILQRQDPMFRVRLPRGWGDPGLGNSVRVQGAQF